MENSDDSDIFEEEGVIVESASPEKVNRASGDEATLLSKLKISVGEAEKRTKVTGLKMQETFVVYMIESIPRDAEASAEEEVTSVWRRYSEFELLRNYLVEVFPTVIVPPLPEKRANFIWTKITATDTYDVEFLERRRAGLESFLHRITGHPKMTTDALMKHFICKQDNWREAVLATGFQAKADSWLRKMNASLRVKNTDIRFEQLKAYANHLQTESSSLLKVRAKLAERLYGIYKIHGNYTRIFKEWALSEEPPLRDDLQKASTEIDLWANSVDNLVDEEDLIAEQLKEYLYFVESLRTICKKHEAMQYDVEWYENQLMLAMAEKKQLLTGNVKSFSFSGMKTRLLGGDTAEQIQQKTEQLDRNIANLEEKFESSKSLASNFLDEALQEVEAFKKRKAADLQDIFISYAVLQIKIHREGSVIWSKFQSIFDTMLEQTSAE